MKPATKTRNGGRWTEARYWSFIRSGLRRMSVRWGPIHDCRKAARRAIESQNKRLKWEYQCALCGGWFSGKDTQVDHIQPLGKLSCWQDVVGFGSRLFCEVDNLRVLCSECHDKRRSE